MLIMARQAAQAHDVPHRDIAVGLALYLLLIYELHYMLIGVDPMSGA